MNLRIVGLGRDWSANRKIDVVLRLLPGESIEDLSREVGVVAPQPIDHLVHGEDLIGCLRRSRQTALNSDSGIRNRAAQDRAAWI